MKFWGKKKETEPLQTDKRLVASIDDSIAAGIFQEILRDNGIPFICSQPGAGGYIKLLTGGLLVSDNIYVNNDDFERASELYRAYFGSESELCITENSDGE